MFTLYYKPGYKYEVNKTILFPIPWYMGKEVNDGEGIEIVVWDRSPYLKISKGYAWDGASGPTFDTPSAVLASLPHDALYQLMREELIPRSYKAPADLMLWELFLRGMLANKWVKRLPFLRPLCRLRAWVWLRAVQKAAGYATRGDGGHPVIVVETP